MKYSKFYFLVLIFLVFENVIFSQEKIPSVAKIDSLLGIGNRFFRLADFENSLKTLRKTLYYSELIKNDSISAYASNRIARNFSELSEFEKANVFYLKALNYALKASRQDIYVTVLINLGNVNSVKENYNFEKSKNYYLKGLTIARKINDFDEIFLINGNLAWLYFEENKFNIGYKYLEYVNKNASKYDREEYLITLNMLNGMYYSYLNQNAKANAYFLEGINKNDNVVLKEEKQYLYFEYSKFLAKTGDFKEAYINKLKGEKIVDSLFNKLKLSKASIAGINLEIDEYKREINKNVSDKKIQEKSLFKSKIINFLAVFISFILTLWLFFGFKSTKKNRIITDKLIKKNFQLKVAVDKAQVASNVKSQFVSTISHELRTPLYGVIGITDIIYDEHKNLIDNKHLDALKFSAKYLLSLVNDILQISKIEDSKIELENSVFDIHKEVKAIKNALEFIAIKNNINFVVDIDPEIPRLLIGDQTKLIQILMNLVTNALKFTNNGDVLLKLSLGNKINNIFNINFLIKDTGIGISKENQENIFEKFTQIKRDNQDYQGTGLGLSIVKKLIELFNSEIHLESELNKGSSFNFTVGFESSDNNLIKQNLNKNFELQLKILVVEDNKINQLVTQKIIQNYNQSCKIVSSGFEAIEILKNEFFDVILMDINMPELNGFETTIEIRKMAIDVPIIALTAYNRKQVIQEANLSGIDAVLVKPFESEKLFETIQYLLKEKNAD
jgi:signal transduction histidine kinase/CheY-like chemotaxis protein